MNSNLVADSELKAYAASICGKNCSKLFALTNRIPENETAHCDACIHWNNDRCIKYNEVVQKYMYFQGDEAEDGRDLHSLQWP